MKSSEGEKLKRVASKRRERKKIFDMVKSPTVRTLGLLSFFFSAHGSDRLPHENNPKQFLVGFLEGDEKCLISKLDF
jgi:hypothetical protein